MPDETMPRRSRKGATKIRNGYLQHMPYYGEMPKAVLGAIAFSLAMQLSGDDFDVASALVAEEWGILNSNGIVPQKPGKKTRECARQKATP